jgi:hypothetical protein
MADGTARLGRAELTAVLQWRRLRRRILFSFPCREFLSRLVRVVRCCAVPGNATGLVSRQSRTHVVGSSPVGRKGETDSGRPLKCWFYGLLGFVPLFCLRSFWYDDELAELQNCLQN